MGDHFQTVVDLDAGADEAALLADRAVGWLVAEGIVLAERTGCVLGEPLGHPPGLNWHRAVAEEDADWKPSDGLAVEVGRTVFDGGQGEPEAVTCPRCAVTTSLVTDGWELIDEIWRPFGGAMDEWQQTGSAQVACPACAEAVPLPEWRWADDYLTFAHLGFRFWNWPEFTPEFQSRFSRALGGHRTRLVWGKL
ncbi:hypothetical protein QMA61_21255 [Streptomyces coelicoflavus]|uniref:hypothetical protein n=1 Tax=Streptomyces coelicoflavus TaxID=285562 RepID=UPI0024AE7F9C|nr:hypothetical protein [Streptomyces coelicoflavus]MDI6518723.1 hypothetical protein [Streptomyces coelicoflavus]